MKQTILIIAILLIIGCSQNFDDELTGFTLYYLPEFSGLETHADIINYLSVNVTYRSDTTLGEIDKWKSPMQTLISGTGDCEDFAIAYINIAWFVLGERCDLVFVDTENISARGSVDGGFVNHAIVYSPERNLYFEAQSQRTYSVQSVGYMYTFNELFPGAE